VKLLGGNNECRRSFHGSCWRHVIRQSINVHAIIHRDQHPVVGGSDIICEAGNPCARAHDIFLRSP
jgi:hypothetical protein